MHRPPSIATWMLAWTLILFAAGDRVAASNLPPSAERDMHLIRLAEHLKAEQWADAYPLFEKIIRLTEQHELPADDSVLYYYGEASLKLKKYAAASTQLGRYIRFAGNEGAFYSRALTLLAEIEELKSSAADIFEAAKPWELTVDKKGKPARDWLDQYRQAAELGHAEAQAKLGRFYRLGIRKVLIKDSEESLKWYRLAAEQNNSAGLEGLAFAYFYGKGVDQDIAKSVALYEQAADLGSARAHFSLGAMYSRGRNVERDLDTGMLWFHKLASNSARFPGYAPHAAKRLGDLYQTKGNQEEYLRWYRVAAGVDCLERNQGECPVGKATVGSVRYSEQARITLASHYVRGRGVQRDYAAALRLYKSVPKNTYAQTGMGAIYYTGGYGVEKEITESRRWYARAVEQLRETKGSGSTGQAHFFLAEFLKEGKGGPKDTMEAIALYRECAALKAYPYPGLAAARLGELYDKGLGVEPDLLTAVEWYKKAVESDGLRYSPAEFRLGEILEKGATGVSKDLLSALRYYSRVADNKNVVKSDDKATRKQGELAQSRAERLVAELIQDFVDASDSSEPVETTASGLRYQILEKGHGTAQPTSDDSVEVRYRIGLLDGTDVDNNPEAKTVVVSSLLSGMAEGLKMMDAGDRFRLFAPAKLGFGHNKREGIPISSMLVIEIELVAFAG